MIGQKIKPVNLKAVMLIVFFPKPMVVVYSAMRCFILIG
jgi:hypothetical protein